MYNRNIELPDARMVPKKGLTFAEVYEKYYQEKFELSGKAYSDSMKASTKSAFGNTKQLHDRVFTELTYDDLQSCLDDCKLKHSSLELISILLKQMYKYARKHELIEKNPAQYLEIRIPDDDEHGVPLEQGEIDLIWKDYRQNGTETAGKILVMIYSGFRISAYRSLTVRLEPDWTLTGGVKTQSGKNRTVPIHSAIQPIVKELVSRDGKIDIISGKFNGEMREYLPSIGIKTDHTPHDMRHTFSMLCERYGVPEMDRKRLLGHKISDITSGTYGHRSIDDLRQSIEKIVVNVW